MRRGLAVCLIWGTTYLGIRIALETIPPLLMAAMRWITAGGLMVALLALRGETAAGAARVAVARDARDPAARLRKRRGGLGGADGAERADRGAGRDVAVLDGRHRGDRCRRRADHRSPRCSASSSASPASSCWCGRRSASAAAAAAFLGGVIAAQIACIGWAIGSSYARHRGRGTRVGRERARHRGVRDAVRRDRAADRRARAARDRRGWRSRRAAAAPLVYLIFVGAIGGFSAYAYALKHLPVATVSLYAYVNPVIAVVLGTLVLSEPFNVRMIGAAAVVFVGIVLVKSR